MARKKRGIFDTERTIYYLPESPAITTWPPPTAATPPAPAPAKPTSDSRADTVEAGVTVPTLQAAVTALFPAILIATLSTAAAITWQWPWWIPPLATLVTWSTLASLQTWRYIELRQVWDNELLQQRDLNHDGHIGPPPPQQTIKVELSELNGHHLTYPDLGSISDSQLLAFARGLQVNESLAEARWSGSGKPFSKPDFITFRDNHLIPNGMAKWVNPQAHAQGAVLTSKGRAMFRAIANHSPTSE